VLRALTRESGNLKYAKTGAFPNVPKVNSIMAREDDIVKNVQLAIDSMPNNKKYGKIKQKYKKYLKSYLRSYSYQGAFKGNRVVGTRYDPRTGMSFVPKEGELENIYAEHYGTKKDGSTVQDILNIGGAMASPSGEIGVTPQPIQLFE
jgi:hypothetical protein